MGISMKKIKLASLLALGLVASNLNAAAVSKTIEFDLDASSDQVRIFNLAGQVKVVPSQDAKIRVRGEVTAIAESESKAENLLERIDFEFSEKKNQDIVTVKYPVREYRHFVYRPEAYGSHNSDTKYMDRKVRVSSRLPKRGRDYAEVHTDLVIELPQGQKALALVRSGEIEANNLDNQLTLGTSSGGIRIKNSQGQLLADTGSGDVRVDVFKGAVTVDTGSGDITLNSIQGDVDSDTGSGDIFIDDIQGSVKADTGSGDVRVHEFSSGETVYADTGSGDVSVAGDFSRVQEIEVDTGSGDVMLIASAPPSLEIDIETGSGRIRVDLPDLDVQRDKRGDFEAVAGSGNGEANIDTGSGSVTLKMSENFSASNYVLPQKAVAQEVSTDQENVELAERLRAKLNADADIRKADLYITARGDQAVIEGEVEGMWTVAKLIKLANEVEGVEGVKMNIDTLD